MWEGFGAKKKKKDWEYSEVQGSKKGNWKTVWWQNQINQEKNERKRLTRRNLALEDEGRP